MEQTVDTGAGVRLSTLPLSELVRCRNKAFGYYTEAIELNKEADIGDIVSQDQLRLIETIINQTTLLIKSKGGI